MKLRGQKKKASPCRLFPLNILIASALCVRRSLLEWPRLNIAAFSCSQHKLSILSHFVDSVTSHLIHLKVSVPKSTRTLAFTYNPAF